MADERAWLCENGEVLPSYITVEHGMLTWTKDPLKALRLARRADAENDCRNMRGCVARS